MSSPSPTPQPESQRAPGWYPDDLGVTRFWDGKMWTEHTAPPPPPTQVAAAAAPPVAGTSPYTQPPVFVQPNVRQARDRAQYTRGQKGHSIIRHLLFGWMVLYIPTIYYAVSPNHYFHT
jgi:uncharacterized protein DUF2510